MNDVRDLSYEVLRAIIDGGPVLGNELYYLAQHEMNRRLRDWVDNMPSSPPQKGEG